MLHAQILPHMHFHGFMVWIIIIQFSFRINGVILYILLVKILLVFISILYPNIYTLPVSICTLPVCAQAGAEVLFGHQITHIYRRGPYWEVHRKEGSPEQFDVVILTMPIPQILQLQGDVASCKYLIRHTHTPAQWLRYLTVLTVKDFVTIAMQWKYIYY